MKIGGPVLSRWVFAGLALGALAWGPARAQDIAVDLEVVLAVDSSSSVNAEEFNLQLQGYADAFLNPAVVKTISNGDLGAIAATLVIWAGDGGIRQIAEWMLIDDLESASRFVKEFRKTPRYMLKDGTSISTAIIESVSLFKGNGFSGARRVIDISGDGTNNVGRPVPIARDAAIEAGVTINGLTILNEFPELDTYFSRFVVGGPGAFIVTADSFSTFSAAILNKLVQEIAGSVPPGGTMFADVRDGFWQGALR